MIPKNLHILLLKDQGPSTVEESQKMQNIPYCKAIGLLMWAALRMQPDIAFTVSLLSRFMENLGQVHWEAVKRVIRYLKGMRNIRLIYGEGEHRIVGYTNADWD
jgi:hypothetical protein